MKKKDNDRLLKAIVISITFHGVLFFGMNFFNWFPDANHLNKYSPLSVEITTINSSVIDNDLSYKNETSKVPEPVAKHATPPSSVPSPSNTISPVKENNDFDPYADLGINSDSAIPPVTPDTNDIAKQNKYIPTNKNSIEFESNVPTDSKVKSQHPDAISENYLDKQKSILSDNELSSLVESLEADSGNTGKSSSYKEADATLYTYNDSNVKIVVQGVQRQLLTNPPPRLPDKLPDGFPNDFTYHIRFSLNQDGLIKVLSITPPSVYPEIEVSILKALRSWTFNKSTDSKEIKGTITLIFKVK